jgi:hypothetical protein
VRSRSSVISAILAENYGGLEGATYVRDTLAVYAERDLSPRCG